MVSTRGVQEVDVWGAADALLLEGARPTIERIRQRLGRGSPNTVGPLLDTWFKGLGARIQDPGAFASAPKTPDAVAQAAHFFWEAALATARGEVTASLASERTAIDQYQDALEARSAQLDLQAAKLLQRSAAEQETLQLARLQLDELREQVALLQRRLETAERDLGVAQEQLRSAHAARDGVIADASLARQAWAEERRTLEQRSTEQQRHWLQEIDRGRTALRVAEKDAESQRTQLERVRSAKVEAELLTKQTSHELQQQREVVARLKEDLANIRTVGERRERALQGQLDALTSQLATAVAALAAPSPRKLAVRPGAQKKPIAGKAGQSAKP